MIRSVELFRCLEEKKMPAVGLTNMRWHAPLDLAETDVERFGDTAWRLVGVAGNLMQKYGAAPETASSPDSSFQGWLNV